MKFRLALFALSTTATLGSAQIIIQKGNAVQAIDVAVPGGPGTTPAKAREEVKVDPKTDPNPKSLEIPADQITKAKDLVRTLGSISYRDRENATRELQKMGRAALAPLSQARATETSPEIRLRTEICLPFAEADDMRARVNCFLADADGKYEHTLPGWSRFKEVLGNDKSARELFAEVIRKRDMHQLLMASELPASELSQVLGNHYREIQGRMNGMWAGRNMVMQQQPPSTPEIIVLAFLESLHSDKELSINYNYGLCIGNYFYQPDIQNAMGPNQAGKYAQPIRKVIGRWLDTRNTAMGCQQAMNFAQQWQLKNEIPKLAARTLNSEPMAGNPWIRIQAMNLLANHISQNKKTADEYLESFVKCFDDTSVIQQAFVGRGIGQQQGHNIVLGDFALGIALSVTNQDPKEYGLETMSKSDGMKFNQGNYFFRNEEGNKSEDKRKAAHKKWEEWAKKAKEPKKDEPKKDEPKKDEPKKDEPKIAPPPPQVGGNVKGIKPLPPQIIRD